MNILACDLEYVQVSGGRSVMAKCAIVNLACEIILNITVDLLVWVLAHRLVFAVTYSL